MPKWCGNQRSGRTLHAVGHASAKSRMVSLPSPIWNCNVGEGATSPHSANALSTSIQAPSAMLLANEEMTRGSSEYRCEELFRKRYFVGISLCPLVPRNNKEMGNTPLSRGRTTLIARPGRKNSLREGVLIDGSGREAPRRLNHANSSMSPRSDVLTRRGTYRRDSSLAKLRGNITSSGKDEPMFRYRNKPAANID